MGYQLRYKTYLSETVGTPQAPVFKGPYKSCLHRQHEIIAKHSTSLKLKKTEKVEIGHKKMFCNISESLMLRYTSIVICASGLGR